MYANYSDVNGHILYVSCLYLCSTIHLQNVYIDVCGEVPLLALLFGRAALWDWMILDYSRVGECGLIFRVSPFL